MGQTLISVVHVAMLGASYFISPFSVGLIPETMKVAECSSECEAAFKHLALRIVSSDGSSRTL